MLEKIRQSKMLTLLLITAVVYFFLRYLTPLFSPILVAMLFVTIFGPFLKSLQARLRIHRQVGAILLLVLGFGLLVVLVWVLFSWIVGSLPEWVGQLEALEPKLEELIQKGSESIGEMLGIDGEYLESTLLARLEEWMDYFQNEGAAGMLSGSLLYLKKLALLGGFLVTFVIATVLLARDYDRIMNNLLDREEFHVLLEVICGIIRYIATFVKAQVVIMSLISLTAGGSLDMRHPARSALGDAGGIVGCPAFYRHGDRIAAAVADPAVPGFIRKGADLPDLIRRVRFFAGDPGTPSDRETYGDIAHCRADGGLCGNPSVWGMGDHKRPAWIYDYLPELAEPDETHGGERVEKFSCGDCILRRI